jgi:hypothetical protein
MVCRKLTSKGEKLWHVAGYEVVEGSQDIRGRLRAGECAWTCVALQRTQICHPVVEASCDLSGNR